jgi:fatty-acyl-CoA synthase
VNEFLTAVIESAHRDGSGLVAGEPGDLRKVTWREVHREARCISGALRAHGVRHGDAVAVLAGSPREIAPLVQGIWLAGASVTMLHQPTPRTDLAIWLGDAQRALDVIDAKLVVVGTPFDDVIPAFRGLSTQCVVLAELFDGEAVDPVPTTDGDTAFLQFTSGSTGTPKAVTISYRNMFANISAMAEASSIRRGHDVMISWLPLFHDMGMMGFLVSPMVIGIDIVCVTPLDFLDDPLLWAKLVSDYRGTMSAAPNFAYALLARRLERAREGAYDLSSMRFVLCGAEPIDATVVQRFLGAASRFGLEPGSFVPAYGMAEATLAISFTRPGEIHHVDLVDSAVLQTSQRAMTSTAPDAARYIGLGRILPGLEVRIVADNGGLCDCRQVGEIFLRGDSVTAGYLTETGYVKATDDAGWLPTGDRGYLTEDEQLVVCGRSKDMVIVSGRNVYPVDIERAAARVQGVRPGNAAAVRMSESGSGEGFAVIVESADRDDDAERTRIEREVAVRVFEELGVTPRRVVAVGIGDLPKTPSGKLRRLQARDLLDAYILEPAPMSA